MNIVDLIGNTLYVQSESDANGVDDVLWFIKINSTGGTCDYSGDGEC